MTRPVSEAVDFAAARGRGIAPSQVPAVRRRAGARIRRLRRAYGWGLVGSAVGVLSLVLLLQPAPAPVETGTPAATPVAPSPISGSAGLPEQRARTVASSVGTRQSALVCEGDPRTGVADECAAVSLGDAPLIDVSGTVLTVGPEADARVVWRVENVSGAPLSVDLAAITVAVVGDDALPSPIAPVEAASVSTDVTVASGGSWWASSATRYVLGGASSAVATLERGRTISGTVTLPAGSVVPEQDPHVLIQVGLGGETGDGGRVVLEGASTPVTGIAATAAILGASEPRTAADAPRADLAALRCPSTGADDDRLADRWGPGYLWTPTCAPLWLAVPVLGDVVVRADLDRSPYTRVVRWSAVNVSGSTLAVDVAATTAVLELDPPVAPHAARLWATSGEGLARIDTLWRTPEERTAAIRGPGSDIVLIGPGETVAGSAAFHFPVDGQAEAWGERLERSAPVVHLVLRTAGLDEDVLVLELTPG